MTIKVESTRQLAPLLDASAALVSAPTARGPIAPNAPLVVARAETPRGLATPQATARAARADTFPSSFAQRAFEVIQKSYVDAIAPSQLTAAGLSGLRAVEPALDARVDGNAIVVTWAGAPIAHDVPTSNAVADQLASASRLMGAITSRSQRLASMSGSRLSEGFVAGMRSQLDQYSRALLPDELAELRRGLTMRTVSTAAADARAPAPDTIPVIKIPVFTETTAAEVRAALEPLVRAGAQGVVIDLRGSGGGLTSASAATADVFLSSGRTFNMEARDPDYIEKPRAHRDGSPLETTRIVILVDGATQSAAESFAATLGDVGRAVLVGHPTRGKGSSQGIFDMPGGYGLVMSVARFYGPTGAQIDETGVTPAVCYNGQANSDGITNDLLEARRMPANSGRNAIVAHCASVPSHDPDEVLAAKNLLADSAAFTRAQTLQRQLAGRVRAQ